MAMPVVPVVVVALLVGGILVLRRLHALARQIGPAGGSDDAPVGTYDAAYDASPIDIHSSGADGCGDASAASSWDTCDSSHDSSAH